MQIIIHRGTKEIGGSCVEVISGDSRILIDLGIPLVTPIKEPFDTKILEGKSVEQLKMLKILPDIKGLYKGEPMAIDAILISHSHLDHYGFLKYIHPDIPIYLSEGAQRLIEISNIFIPHKTGKLNTLVLPKWKEIAIRDFKITGYLVDHSAFDAMAFLIESDGKRLFYSGDFRGHGRKSVLFKKMIDKPPAKIDCLLMEGSMLGREKQTYETETDIQNTIENICIINQILPFYSLLPRI
ncbi:MAG: MBL fold metallo-hydrolase [Planctomycetota bacterium]